MVELHGNIWRTRCTAESVLGENDQVPLPDIPPKCPRCGEPVRPDVVWFGEALDSETIEIAFRAAGRCQLMFVVGTSAVVHPAASLPLTAGQAGALIVEVNPDPTPLTPHADFSFRGASGEILPALDTAWRKFSKSKE